MFTISGGKGDGAERQRFAHGGAGTVQPEEGNAHSGNPERGGGSLRQKVACKDEADVPGSQPGLSHSDTGSFFLQCAFRRFPGVCAEHGILADHIKGRIRGRLLPFC